MERGDLIFLEAVFKDSVDVAGLPEIEPYQLEDLVEIWQDCIKIIEKELERIEDGEDTHIRYRD